MSSSQDARQRVSVWSPGESRGRAEAFRVGLDPVLHPSTVALAASHLPSPSVPLWQQVLGQSSVVQGSGAAEGGRGSPELFSHTSPPAMPYQYPSPYRFNGAYGLDSRIGQVEEEKHGAAASDSMSPRERRHLLQKMNSFGVYMPPGMARQSSADMLLRAGLPGSFRVGGSASATRGKHGQAPQRGRGFSEGSDGDGDGDADNYSTVDSYHEVESPVVSSRRSFRRGEAVARAIHAAEEAAQAAEDAAYLASSSGADNEVEQPAPQQATAVHFSSSTVSPRKDRAGGVYTVSDLIASVGGASPTDVVRGVGEGGASRGQTPHVSAGRRQSPAAAWYEDEEEAMGGEEASAVPSALFSPAVVRTSLKSRPSGASAPPHHAHSPDMPAFSTGRKVAPSTEHFQREWQRRMAPEGVTPAVEVEGGEEEGSGMRNKPNFDPLFSPSSMDSGKGRSPLMAKVTGRMHMPDVAGPHHTGVAAPPASAKSATSGPGFRIHVHAGGVDVSGGDTVALGLGSGAAAGGQAGTFHTAAYNRTGGGSDGPGPGGATGYTRASPASQGSAGSFGNPIQTTMRVHRSGSVDIVTAANGQSAGGTIGLSPSSSGGGLILAGGPGGSGRPVSLLAGTRVSSPDFTVQQGSATGGRGYTHSMMAAAEGAGAAAGQPGLRLRSLQAGMVTPPSNGPYGASAGLGTLTGGGEDGAAPFSPIPQPHRIATSPRYSDAMTGHHSSALYEEEEKDGGEGMDAQLNTSLVSGRVGVSVARGLEAEEEAEEEAEGGSEEEEEAGQGDEDEAGQLSPTDTTRVEMPTVAELLAAVRMASSVPQVGGGGARPPPPASRPWAGAGAGAAPPPVVAVSAQVPLPRPAEKWEARSFTLPTHVLVHDSEVAPVERTPMPTAAAYTPGGGRSSSSGSVAGPRVFRFTDLTASAVARGHGEDPGKTGK